MAKSHTVTIHNRRARMFHGATFSGTQKVTIFAPGENVMPRAEWEENLRNVAVSNWVKLGVLVVGDDSKAPPAPIPETPVNREPTPPEPPADNPPLRLAGVSPSGVAAALTKITDGAELDRLFEEESRPHVKALIAARKTELAAAPPPGDPPPAPPPPDALSFTTGSRSRSHR